jgi:superoxide dismutase, Cu-Zn family
MHTLHTRFATLTTALFTTACTVAFAAATLCAAPPAYAEAPIVLSAVDASGVGPAIGQVRLTITPYGLVLTPDLIGLPPGLHGFHVHENTGCAASQKDGQIVPAGAAGGHYDPAHTGRHGTPWGDGHLGDLPPLYVDASGHANQPVLAPRLTLQDMSGRALVIHAGGDNHADHPAMLGGGGARLYCGVVR